jgi:hypothetical protein
MKNIKEVIRTIIKEESEYQQFFRKALEKAGKSIPAMSDDEKKAFFNKIDAAWDGKGEKNEGNAFGAAVTKAKEEGDDEFTVGGKTYPVKESINESTLKPGTKLRYEKNNFVIDYVVDKEYKGKDGFTKYILKVVKSNYPNKIKVGSTEEYEDARLTGLIRNGVIKFVKNESIKEAKNLKKAKQALIDFNSGKLGEDEMVKAVIKSLGFKFNHYSEEEAGLELSRLIKRGKIPTDDYVLNNVIDVLDESINEAKVIVHNEKTGERFEVLSGKGKGDLLIAMNALQKSAPSHMKYSIKESVNEYDEWKNTRTQSKNIFRMLKQKYNNNISKMRDGLEDILKQNKTKNDQAEVVRDEFNKFFKIKTESVNESKYSDQTGIKSSLLNEPEFTNLFQPKVFNWMRGKDVKIFKVQNYSTIFTITDGKMEIVVNISKPMSVIKPYGRVRREVKDLFSKNESINESFNIRKEVKIGTILYDVQKDKFKVIKVTPKEVHLIPLSYKGDVSVFPMDFGKNVDLDEFWQYFNLKESVNENFSNDDIAKIKAAVESASSFMGIGSELKKLGMKYDFSTSPLPVYMIKKGSKTFVLVNKKYAEKPDFVVGTTAGGLLEGTVNETQFKIGDKIIISHPIITKPIKGIVSSLITAKGEQVLILKGGQGVWDAKFAKLDEGNAFGAAVTAAKKEGKKEFEFNGKIYKVKKGSYEKNEAAKKLAEKKK